MEESKIVLAMTDISKYYSSVQALKNVSFSVKKGTVHALMGENGAGKSTLMKILAGIIQKDAGSVVYKGKQVTFTTPKQAQENGIAMIHQELSVQNEMSITENIFLGKEIKMKHTPLLDYNKMDLLSTQYLARLGVSLPPKTQMKHLTVSQMQMVEIAKAVSVNADIIIMDEPTSAITTTEVEKLFGIIEGLKAEGRCIIYITHKMDEVFRVADEITVFRDGMHIGTYAADEITGDELVRYMVNQSLDEIYPHRQAFAGAQDIVLEVKNISRKGAFKDISFTLRRGEIVGIAGLMGAGRTEVVEGIFGMKPIDAGEMFVKGKAMKIRHPKKAIAQGISLITEDRKQTGLVLNMSILQNITLAATKKLSRHGFVLNKRKMDTKCDEYAKKLNIKMHSPLQQVQTLSGGNQQKVVLGKWLMMQPDILIFDEPTRGIDIGAKTEFYHIIAALAQQGVAVLFISSELQEIIGMCDRTIVMHEGELSGEVDKEHATQEVLLQYAIGAKHEPV